MSKVFAVGTGRCGMNNWAKLVGGYAESEVPLRALAVKYFHDPSTDLSYAVEKFKSRLADPAPGIADCCQHMFINLIHELDPTVEFVWLIREKEACINSFMKKGAENERIHPIGWEFKESTKRDLISWYYDTVNSRINEALKGKKYTIIRTEDMQNVG